MIRRNRIPTHPGEVLLEEFLKPLGVPQTTLAAKLDISVQRINEIVNAKRGITSETAWLFAGAFGNHAGVLDEPAGRLRPGARAAGQEGPASRRRAVS
jgi:addiction module HigA family antidote